MIMAIRNIKSLSMKKLFINIGLITGLSSMLVLTACKENIEPVVSDLSFNRAFTPISLTALISNVTTVTLNWTAVINTDHYVLEIYQGTDFSAASLVRTDNISGDLIVYSYVLPAGDTQFSARLKSVSTTEGVEDSKWISVGFKTAPENLFTGYKSEMTGIGTCTVRWLPGTVATALMFVKGTNQTSYPLTSAEITAGVKNLSGIQNGNYEVRLMNTTFVRGKTNIFLEGDVLLAAGGDLSSAITSVPAGGVIILTNGTSFSFSGPVSLTKSVKIRGLYDTNLPTIFTVLNAATFHMFNIDAALTPADSLVFQSINISGYPNDNTANTRLRGMFDQDAIACNLGSLKFINCIARNFDRHLIRLRGTVSQVIDKIEVNGCVLYDYAFGSNYGVINSSTATSKINNIKIINSTVSYTSAELINYQNGTDCKGITITNCTFNQIAMGSARYLINMSATTSTAAINISNCIFGSTASNANGIRQNTMTISISGSYYTSDFNDGATYVIKSLMTAYSGSSTALWVDPVTTRDFHFLDTGFAGKNTAGDPRWKP
jgi:hypothetical protein